jgi:hypothetical protein
VLIRVEPYCPDQTRVDSREIPPLDNRGRGNLEEVQDLPHTETVVAPPHFEDDNGPLIGGAPFLLKQEVPIEYGKEAAPNVYQPFDRVRHTRNSGSRKAREDLTHDPCRGRADNLTDSKNDGVERGRVSHLY